MDAPACETTCGARLSEWSIACELVLDHASAHFGTGETWSGYWGRGVLHVDRLSVQTARIEARLNSPGVMWLS